MYGILFLNLDTSMDNRISSEFGYFLDDNDTLLQQDNSLPLPLLDHLAHAAACHAESRHSPEEDSDEENDERHRGRDRGQVVPVVVAIEYLFELVFELVDHVEDPWVECLGGVGIHHGLVELLRRWDLNRGSHSQGNQEKN